MLILNYSGQTLYTFHDDQNNEKWVKIREFWAKEIELPVTLFSKTHQLVFVCGKFEQFCLEN